jgi:hypothetical protein
VPIGNSGRVMEAELNDVGERIMEGRPLKGVRWQDGKMVMEFDQAGRDTVLKSKLSRDRT